MTIYLDIIFIENLCINSIILLATALVVKTKVKIVQILISSILGSVYAVVVYLSIAPIFSNVILKILLSVCMVQIAYSVKNLKQLAKILLIFYLTSFTFGGVALALLYFVKPENVFSSNGVLIGAYPVKIAMLAGIVGFAVIIVAFKNIKGRLTKKDMLCEITIVYKEKMKKVKAMIDTGNLLKEPITGNKVIIVEKEELYEILPEQVLENVQGIINGENNIQEDEYATRFRVIPFKSLGKENGILLGFKIETLKIEYLEEEKEITNVIVGIYNGKLSKGSKYNALVGLEII
ncbi:MAG: sigma-E processing peptidase SpoIIGA [Lachnospiraceae bacterium]|jgi:stage II sporulation protein GA (sporulation sigma-E factor processing peptidase)|nr:sigma-E processing peptidase SpoIIGA [Lachnospiraceae bacterium]